MCFLIHLELTVYSAAFRLSIKPEVQENGKYMSKPGGDVEGQGGPGVLDGGFILLGGHLGKLAESPGKILGRAETKQAGDLSDGQGAAADQVFRLLDL